jgi:hypothetical protein
VGKKIRRVNCVGSSLLGFFTGTASETSAGSSLTDAANILKSSAISDVKQTGDSHGDSKAAPDGICLDLWPFAASDSAPQGGEIKGVSL